MIDEKTQTPLTYFELSKSIALDQYHLIEPIVDITSYSSKTNSLVTPILEDNTEALFSIHFLAELQHVKDKSRVFYLAQAWNKEEILFLFAQGVRSFCLDNKPDLDLFLEILATQPEIKVSLFLRLRLKENTIRTEKYFVFGLKSRELNTCIQDIHASPLRSQITTLGVHMHRKTQNMAEWNYSEELADELDEKTLDVISILNIGGGLPSIYANTNCKVLDGIFKKLKSLRTFCNEKNIQLMIEPGRFISAPAVSLHTTIRQIYDNVIVLNASVYNTDMDALIVPVKLLVRGELTKKDAKAKNISAYAIKGITPCSLDLFRYKVYYENPKIGAKLVFENAGAYNFTTTFCDLPTIPTKIIE